MKKIADRGLFFGLVAAFVGTCIALLIMFPNGRSFFVINGMHHPVTDIFFTWFTYAGDGLTAVIIGLMLVFFYRVNAGLVTLLGTGLCGLTVFLLKTYLFTGYDRPKLFFWGNKMVHYVEDYTNIEHSFPSGHSLTAFFCFTFLVLIRAGRSRIAQVVLALAAILAAYSRVYLAHHFVGDILAGALMGMTYAFIMYLVYDRLKEKKWLMSSVIGYINKSGK